MTFPTYSEYKGSGFEWLGQVPEHWQIKALRYLTICLDGKRIPLNGEQRADKQGDVPYWGANAIMDFVDEAIFDEELLLVGEDGAPFLDPFKPVAFHSSGPVWPNNHIHVLRPNRREWVRFLVYAMNAADYANFIEGSTRQKLNQSRLMGMPVCWPSYAEQTQIARFLDHETARIDALIEEQQRLIELLKEKRQAVISHAVTKGLDPTVPMKDSGVEWLGEVPAHWVISQLKFNTLEMQTGPFGSQLHAEDYVDGGIPLVNPAHMIDGVIIPDTQVTVDEVTWQRLKRHALTAGDIIFARRGELGRCAIVTNEQDGWLCGTGSLKAKLNAQLDAEYAYLLITSKGAVAELSLESKGSTMENLNTESLGRIRLPLPPVSEQKAILEYVHEVSGQFSALVDAAESGISLITERRSALRMV